MSTEGKYVHRRKGVIEGVNVVCEERNVCIQQRSSLIVQKLYTCIGTINGYRNVTWCKHMKSFLRGQLFVFLVVFRCCFFCFVFNKNSAEALWLADRQTTQERGRKRAWRSYC